jgi:hypothetical protein
VSDRPSSGGWFGPLAWLAFLGVATALAYFLVIDDGDRCPQGRMPWDCLTWVTIDRYEHQFREDLPLGTPRRKVEDYLGRENIAFSAPAQARPSDGPQLAIKRELPGFWEQTLYITILFDANGSIDEIRFHKSMIAP